jgi:mono/diheme cytochrome c family protein
MAFAVGGATMAHAQQSSPAGRSVAAIGKYDYKEHCAVCHDLSGTGDGIFADFLKSGTVVPSLTELSEKNNGVFPFTRVLRNY